MNGTLVTINILTIVAIIAGPIIALQIQRKLDHERETRSRKVAVFRTLMSFRATALAPTFVQALNLIDIEFDGKNDKEKAVRSAWKVLLDHYGDLSRATEPNSSALAEKSIQLRTNLLISIGRCLDYDFDEVQIRKGAYYPTGLGDVEAEQHAIRRGVLNVLSGKGRVPVAIFEDKFPPITIEPMMPREAEPQKKLGI